jgi:citrate lyase beta subunit
MTSLDSQTMRTLQAGLTSAQAGFAARFPGESSARQPVHVVYGGAHLFKAETAQKLGALARQALTTYAPDALSFAEALDLSDELAARVYPRVVAKLEREPVEDFRIDFEDGYGHRTDEEEDGHALEAARQVARGFAEDLLPPFLGIRIKPMSAELGARAIRTLDLFFTELKRPILITLPKVVSVAQVKLFVGVLDELERSLSFPAKSLRVEFMVEAAQGLIDGEGRHLLPQLHAAADGRLQAAHFGTYDYTASIDVTAALQGMRHPACEFARSLMKLAFAGTGVFLSDGATTQLPIGPHKWASLTEAQREENRRVVHGAWLASVDDIRHSLGGGFYQGWDLHPAQLVARYATVFAFFLESLAPATERLSNFVKHLGQATAVGDSFDDAATGQGLLNYFLRGLACGALTDEDVAATGLTPDELTSRSFAVIARNRRTR